jgi:hypothetical protein
MADFVTHGLIGAGVMSSIGKRLNAAPWVKHALAIYGFVMGTAPDTFDWIVAALGIRPRWELYVYFHHDAPWWWLYQPPFFLHVVIVDPPFHIFPGWDWWSTMWSVELLWVFFAGVLLRYAYRDEIDSFVVEQKGDCMKLPLSPHFDLAEMVWSDFAIRHALDNTPTPEAIIHLRILCVTTLELVRSIWGLPVTVTSGFRSPLVNTGIGGSKTSQHLTGNAADFHIHGVGNLDVIRGIVHSTTFIPFDQLIYEGGEGGWIHISHSTQGKQRREILSADFSTGEPVYSPLEV